MNFIIALLLLFVTAQTEANENMNCATIRLEEEFCGAYTYKIVKPLLDYLQQLKSEIDNSRAQTESKDKEFNELREEVKLIQLRSVNELDITYLIKQSLDLETIKLTKIIDEKFSKWFQALQNEIDHEKKSKDQEQRLHTESLKLKECEVNLRILNDINAANTVKQEQTVAELKETVQRALDELKENQAPSNAIIKTRNICNTSQRSLTSVQKVQISSLEAFEVLCSRKTKGDNWILVQQRLDDKENFFRNWAAYRNGFGAFEHSYFLGLEKLHLLTTDQRYELYIEFEKFNGEITYAIYDHFVIDGEQNQYRLHSLGAFSGNETEDQLDWHRYQKFYTFDRDSSNSCAKKHQGAWWYSTKFCANSNLNGKYFKSQVIDKTSIFWHGHHALKRVQMLMRPRNEII